MLRRIEQLEGTRDVNKSGQKRKNLMGFNGTIVCNVHEHIFLCRKMLSYFCLVPVE